MHYVYYRVFAILIKYTNSVKIMYNAWVIYCTARSDLKPIVLTRLAASGKLEPVNFETLTLSLTLLLTSGSRPHQNTELCIPVPLLVSMNLKLYKSALLLDGPSPA